jgi:hypothetical protein
LLTAIILLATNLFNRFNDVFAQVNVIFQSLIDKLRMLGLNTQSAFESIGKHLQTVAVCVQGFIASLIQKTRNIASISQAVISWGKSRVEQTISNVNYIIQKSSELFSQFENIEFK